MSAAEERVEMEKVMDAVVRALAELNTGKAVKPYSQVHCDLIQATARLLD